MPPKRRRGRGEGALFQTHTPDCPPPGEDGKRPRHVCHGLWRGHVKDDLGKRHYVYAKTKASALEKLSALRQELAEHGNPLRGKTTVEKWLTYWLEHIVVRKARPGTLASYRVYVTQHLIPFIGGVRLDRLARHHIRQLHRDLERTDKKRGTGTLSYATIASAHGVLSAALTDAVREGLLRVNVAKDERPTGTAPTRDHLTTDQARALLTATADDRLASRWMFALLTGCRQGERLGLRWHHVDLDAGTADISWQLKEVPWSHGCDGDCGRRPASCPGRRLAIHVGLESVTLHGQTVLLRPKRGKRKILPLPPYAVASLRARRDEYEQERGKYTTDHGLVWCHTDGRPITRRTDYGDWRTALETAGLPHVTVHGIRHTTASLLDELGVPESVVQEILGHSRVTTTRAYTHRDLSQARAALTALGETLSGSQADVGAEQLEQG